MPRLRNVRPGRARGPLPLCRSLPLALGATAALATAQNPTLLAVDGTGAYDQLGLAVARLGDVDGDGSADFLVAAPFADSNGIDAGTVQVRSGRTGLLLRALTGDGPTAQFGSAVAGGADLDHDGVADLIVGAPGDDAAGQDRGLARVFSGRTGQVLFTVRGLAVGDRLGDAVGFAGDVDGDGTPDFAAGAPLADAPGIDAGRAHVWSGRTGQLLWSGSGLTGDHYGHRIGGVGDVDGDGRDDFLVSAPWSDQVASKCGSAMVLSGRTHAQLFIWFGTGLGHEFGTSFAAPGDVDGDGFADVAVSAPEDKTFGDDSGSVRVFRGATGAVMWWWYGDSAYDYFGHSIDAGDFDGDGRAEILVGAPYDETTGVPANGGIARVFSCTTGSLLFQVGGNQSLEQMSRATAAAGDCNGDGLCEVLVGAPLRDAAGNTDAGGFRVFCGQAAAPAVSVFGTGCPGAQPLLLGYLAPARLGQPLAIQLSHGPAVAVPGWLVHDLGADVPAPTDLSPLGLPGCTLLVGADAVTPVLLVAGGATTTLTVPAALAPWGLVLRQQAACLDPLAPGGFRLSNGGRALVAR